MRHSFATLSGGRPPGQEDVHSHYRKGIPGEWQKYFTPELAGRFESLFGEVLLMGVMKAPLAGREDALKIHRLVLNSKATFWAA